MNRSLVCAISVLSLWASAVAEEPPGKQSETLTPAEIEFFEKKVRPVLADNCIKCHGPKIQQGELRLDSRTAILKGGESGPAIVPGSPNKSELISAINYEADGFQMPPPGKLKPEEIAALTLWVKRGAPWPGLRQAGCVLSLKVQTTDAFGLPLNEHVISLQVLRVAEIVGAETHNFWYCTNSTLRSSHKEYTP